MSTHVHTHSPLMAASAGTAPVEPGRDLGAKQLPGTGVLAALARFGRGFIAALVESRAAQALAEIEAYDHRLGAELRAAMQRDGHPLR
jgi:hypothetical protein